MDILQAQDRHLLDRVLPLTIFRRAKTSSGKLERFSLAQDVVSKRAFAVIRRARRTTNNDFMWHVYIIQCSDGSLYTGVTTDISRRLNEHNQKSGGSYTRTRTPVKLVYQEPRSSQFAAFKRESQIKRWTKQKKLALISGNLSLLRDISKSRD